MLWPDGVREKRCCGFHDRNSYSINDCRVFRMRIQKAIQEGHLKFDNKMKLDGHPFPQNMVGFSVNMVTAEEKGKVKVLTSVKSKTKWSSGSRMASDVGAGPRGNPSRPQEPC
jgi:hypothetical protein